MVVALGVEIFSCATYTSADIFDELKDKLRSETKKDTAKTANKKLNKTAAASHSASTNANTSSASLGDGPSKSLTSMTSCTSFKPENIITGYVGITPSKTVLKKKNALDLSSDRQA